MEQRCHLAMVWLTWLGLPLLTVLVGFRAGVVAGLAVLAAGERNREAAGQSAGYASPL